MPVRDIGIDVTPPAREPAPGDQKNPFNGTLRVRGSVIVGTVVSNRMQATAVVEKQHERVVQKFERIEKRTRHYAAHIPSNIDVKVGDEVVIAECRPLSKTVHFVVVENRGNPAERRVSDTGAPSMQAKREAATAAAQPVRKARAPAKKATPAKAGKAATATAPATEA